MLQRGQQQSVRAVPDDSNNDRLDLAGHVQHAIHRVPVHFAWLPWPARLRQHDADLRPAVDRDGLPGRPATIVAVAGDTICGFATTGPSQDEDAADAGELYAIYLDPQAWGRGIGRSLMAEARARLSRQGFAEAILWVLEGNERAKRFYRADGWQPDGHQRQEDVWGVSADEVRYRRSLP